MNSHTYQYLRFGGVYDEGAYGSCTYNSSSCTSVGTTTTGGNLVNTGVAVAGVVTLVCLIVLIAVLVRVWRRPAKLTVEQAIGEVETATPQVGDPVDHRHP